MDGDLPERPCPPEIVHCLSHAWSWMESTLNHLLLETCAWFMLRAVDGDLSRTVGVLHFATLLLLFVVCACQYRMNCPMEQTYLARKR